jgi:hypothetical protein
MAEIHPILESKAIKNPIYPIAMNIKAQKLWIRNKND